MAAYIPHRIGKWPPEIAVSSWSMHASISSGKLSIFDFPRFVREDLGLGFLEIVVNHLPEENQSNFEKLRDCAMQAGCAIVCLALSNDFTVKEWLQQEVAHAQRLIAMAAIMNTPVVRINPGIKSTDPEGEQINCVADGMTALLSDRQTHERVIALENHQILGLNFRNILAILEKVRHNSAGACLDFGNFYPEDLHSGPNSLSGYAVHVHAKAYGFSEDGTEKTINYLDRLRELRTSGFTGYISIEYEGEAGSDEKDGTIKTRNLITRCLKELESEKHD